MKAKFFHVFAGVMIALTLVSSRVFADDWTQEAHDAQRTGYSSEEPSLPWSYAWSWNGPDSNGNTTGNFYDAPLRDAHVITGGGKLFAPAATRGLYALNLETGAQLWQYTGGDVQGTPAYDSATNMVFVGTRDGKIVKLSAQTGTVQGTFSTGETIIKPLLLIPGAVFAVTNQGGAHKINTATMTRDWVYQAGSEITTTATYSQSKNSIVFGTNDLFVHAVSSAGGSVWKVKPTTRSASEYCGWYNYDHRWPVVADTAGVVFIRLRNPHPFDDGGNTSAEIRGYLTNNPQYQTLFALDLNSGAKKFIPAIQPDGSDHRPDCNGVKGALFHAISAAPVIKTIGGKQFAYMPWRNSQATYDARWDAFMGEMVLDDSSVPGYSAGDLRLMQFKGQIDTNMIADEIHPVTMAGNSIFHHHTNNVDSHRITDRSNGKGATTANPITTVRNPEIVRHWATTTGVPSNPNKSTHQNNDLTVYDRYYGTGFWIYQGNLNKEMILSPEISQGATESLGAEEGSVNRYTFVAGGKIITTGPRGDIFVLRHSGAVSATPTPAPTANPTATPIVTSSPTPSSSPIPSGSLVAGTGQAVSASPNVTSMATQAITEAKSAYEANGGAGTTPKVAIIMENTLQGSAITSAIRAVYPNVLILGVENADQSYTPYTSKNMPAVDTDKSISIMLLGGSAINVTYATGIADFASNSNTEAQKGGQNLASKLPLVSGSKNLLLVMGQMHSPLNEYVVAGMRQVYGNVLPSNLKIVGWSGAYWGGAVFNNGVMQTNQIIGILISGNFNWALTGINHGVNGWDGSGPENGDPVAAITASYSKIIAELGRVPAASFMVIAHPDRSLFPSIRSAIVGKIGSAPMIGMHGGSEIGHDTTAGDVIADGNHYYLAGIAPAGTSSPTPVTAKPGDGNNDLKVDGIDYVLWLNNFGITTSSGPTKGDYNRDTKVDGIDYVLWLNNFGL